MESSVSFAVVVGDLESGLARVQSVKSGLVRGQDAGPPQGHLRGQLLVLLGEGVQQRGPQGGPGEVSQVPSRTGQLIREHLLHVGRCEHRVEEGLVGLPRQPLQGGPQGLVTGQAGRQLRQVGHHQRHRVRPVVAVHEHLQHQRRAGQGVLQRGRHHELAVLELELLLDAARDLEEAAPHESAQVPGAEEALPLLVQEEHLLRGLGIVVVAAHHRGPRHRHLAVRVRRQRLQRVRVHHGHGDPPQRQAHGPQQAVPQRRAVHGHGGRRLGEPVPLQHGQPDGLEELQHGLRHGGAPAGQQLDARADLVADLAEHGPVQQAVLQGQPGPHRPARGHQGIAVPAHPEGVVEDGPAEEGALVHGLHHPVEDLVVEHRHRHEQRGLRGLQAVHDQLPLLHDAQRVPVGQHAVQLAGQPVHVCPGQEGQRHLPEQVLAQQRPRALHHGRHVGVGQLHALGVPRGAGRVDDARQVLRARGNGRHGHRAGGCEQSVEAVRLGGLAVHHDGRLQPTQLPDVRLELAVDALVRHNHELGRRVREDVGPVLLRLRLIHWYDLGTERVYSVETDCPLHPVVANQRHFVIIAYVVLGGKNTAECADGLIEFLVCHPLILPILECTQSILF
mmetsp:Transcript_28386/g.40418  ORF Transcript_28386/g.40418 Transcript_28386/m.40418 type:complete len:618 (+) Transcript_28386:137-1990(+)